MEGTGIGSLVPRTAEDEGDHGMAKESSIGSGDVPPRPAGDVGAAIRAGALMPDLDIAVAGVQEALGVTEGDLAGVWFSGMGHEDGHSDEMEWWASLDTRRRVEALAAYAAHEALYVGGEA